MIESQKITLNAQSTLSKLTDHFVARGKEIEQLVSHLGQAASGYGRFLVVSGVAGIGVTKLVKHFAGKALDAGAQVAAIDFNQYIEYNPYQPFKDLVAQLAGEESEKTAIADSETEQAELEDSLEAQNLNSLQANGRLTQQKLIAQLLKPTRTNLVLIILYGAQAAPLSAWKFIHYLCQSISDKRLLLVAAMQESNIGKTGPQHEVLQRISQEDLVRTINLYRFSEDQLKLFLNAVFIRRDFSSRFTGGLYEVTDGIPNTVIKYLRELILQEIVFLDKGIWFHREGVNKEFLQQLFRREDDSEVAKTAIANLSTDFKTLLQYVALMKGSVSHKLLSVVTKRSRVDVIKDLNAMKKQGLLASQTPERFQVEDSALRSAILSEISEKNKEAMHQTIAAGLEVDSSLGSSERIYYLAHHFSHTRNSHLAFKYLCQAGKIAAKHFAFTEARSFFERALKALNKPAGNKEAVHVLMWLGSLERLMGNSRESIQQYDEALKHAGKNNRKLWYQIKLQQSLSYFRLHDWDRAEIGLQQCLRNRDFIEPYDVAMAHYGMGNLHFERGEFDASYDSFEESIRIAQTQEANQLLANLFNSLGAIENIRGDRLHAINMYSKSIPIFEALSDDFGLAGVYNNIGMTHADENNWEDANKFYSRSLTISDEMGLISLKSITFLNRAYALAMLNELESAREYNLKAHRLLERLKDELGLAEYHKIQGIIERIEGDWQEAKMHLDKALLDFETLDNKLGEAETQHELALLALAMEDAEQAARWLGAARASYKELGLEERFARVEESLSTAPTEIQEAIKIVQEENIPK